MSRNPGSKAPLRPGRRRHPLPSSALGNLKNVVLPPLPSVEVIFKKRNMPYSQWYPVSDQYCGINGPFSILKNVWVWQFPPLLQKNAKKETPIKNSNFWKEDYGYLMASLSYKAFQGNVVNRTFYTFNEMSLEIACTVPFIWFCKMCIWQFDLSLIP